MPFENDTFANTCTAATPWGRWVNTLRPRQNGRHFADDTFKRIFLNENVRISIKISLKFVPKGPINNNPAWVQIMAWRRSGDKPLSEPMMVRLPTHICVTRPQWVKLHCPTPAGPMRSHRDPLTAYEFSFILCYFSCFVLYFSFLNWLNIFHLIFWIFSYYKHKFCIFSFLYWQGLIYFYM